MEVIFMRLGFHLSIGKGLPAVLAEARRIGCDTIQIFGRNPRQWAPHRFPASEIYSFARARRESGIAPLVVHLSYLPNLAGADPDRYRRSCEALAEEWALAARLGAEYLVIHAGHHLGIGTEAAHQRIAAAVAKALTTLKPTDDYPMLLLENAAGQGSEVGVKLEELRQIRLQLGPLADRVGFCLDTAHALAAGYRLHCRRGLAEFLAEVRLHLGLDQVKLLHLNDSKAPCGARIDRHWHLGCGAIGANGFRRILRAPDLQGIPAIMETPKQRSEDDSSNLYRARKLQ
jgi:deoxyribonuclease-4